MAKLLFSFTWPGEAPSLEQVREHFGLAESEVDAQFGVIEIDPLDQLYSIQVEGEAAQRLMGESGAQPRGAGGVYSNPPIHPFGPPVEE
jgi:hypothetical protein